MTDPTQVEAAELAAGFEGFSSTPYRCPAGVWTIGYGTTHDPRINGPVTAETPPVTRQVAQRWLMDEMQQALETVDGEHLPLDESQRAALMDFVYNLGAGAFRSSTLLKDLKAGNFAAAAAEFDKWDLAAGRPLAGLLRRREAERKLFVEPDPEPTTDTHPNGEPNV